MRTTRFEPGPCPTCGKTLDAATHPTEDVSPSPGDATICIGCGDILIFTDDFGLRNVTEEDIQNLPLEVVSRYQAALNKFRSS